MAALQWADRVGQIFQNIEFKMDVTVSQRSVEKFKVEFRMCITAIQSINNEQDKLRNNRKSTEC